MDVKRVKCACIISLNNSNKISSKESNSVIEIIFQHIKITKVINKINEETCILL
jgi:predicted small metal-binding protein